MKKIVFLLDKTNNWIEPYVNNFIYSSVDGKYKFTISYSYQECIGNEIVFILGNTKILDNRFTATNKLNLVVHESDLPNGKGFSPIQWQILSGINDIVFTLFEATANIDSGDIVLQKRVKFSGYELFDEIRDIQGKMTMEIIREFLTVYPKFDRKKQYGEESIFKRRSIEDDKLDVNKTIYEQFNHFRVSDNDRFPCWFDIDGHKYEVKIYKKNEE